MNPSADWEKLLLGRIATGQANGVPTSASSYESSLSILGGSPGLKNLVALSSLEKQPAPIPLLGSQPRLSSLLSQLSLANTGSHRSAAEVLGTPNHIAPKPTSGWTPEYLAKVRRRHNRRANNLADRIEATTQGRVMPDIDQVSIGSGRQLCLAVMFVDICNFSQWPSGTHDEQLRVLRVMNIFMAEMLSIVREHQGTFEKNTGDGIMAYFGTTPNKLIDASKLAVTAALRMVYVNDHILTPWFMQNGLWPVRFRIGIDAGEVTLAKVGIHNLADQFVAIGNPANIACKIMRLLPEGGICIGNQTRKALTPDLQNSTRQLGDTGFVYMASQAAYPAWELTNRLSEPL